MGGCRCTYKNCQSSTKTTENVHFFHYPVKHPERCRIWIENANKPHFFDLEEDQLKNKVICENHFEDKWFPNHQKKRLLQGAVPTLDVGCEEEVTQSGIYISTGMHDVALLPASSDGSLFILDTDSIYHKSPNIESYVYKNGAIVPSSPVVQLKQEIKHVGTRSANNKTIINSKTLSNIGKQTVPSFLNHTILNNSAFDDPLDTKVVIKDEVMPSSSYCNTLNSELRLPQYNNIEEPIQDPLGDTNQFEVSTHGQPFDEPEKPIRLFGIKNPAISKSYPEKSNLAKNYLRKIKQHSRDIACIKKMLRHKTNAPPKPDIDAVLNLLKEKLPPSLFLLNRLHLTDENELSQEDIDFLTTIQKMSPDLYQHLQEKYKWDLPIVDIID
ncbi:uncharacterized protein [Diabrotica undecimpunctata]|uniref:uncharacterized protein n=1 Tax=Diabrotica undecimpunctata TaxID=50387 RepID=UPI003B637E5A